MESAASFGVLCVFASILLAYLVGMHARPRAAVAPPPRETMHPFDGEPHTLMMIAASGRPNPLAYENFPNYPAALTRQRELLKCGRDCVVTHSDSGAVRVDVSLVLSPYQKISL